MSRKPAPPAPATTPIADPPFVTFADMMRRGDTMLPSFMVSHPEPDSFEILTLSRNNWAIDGTTDSTTFDHLRSVYLNAERAEQVLRACAAHVERLGLANTRTNHAGLNVVIAAQIVDSALLLFLRRDLFYGFGALALLRVALECAARGAFIAFGESNEVTRYLSDNQADRLQANEYWTAGVNELVNPPHTPQVVYTWLCGYTHFDATVVSRGLPARSDVYAALAYVAWFTAHVADWITGTQSATQEPDPMPHDVPWLRTSGAA